MLVFGGLQIEVVLAEYVERYYRRRASGEMATEEPALPGLLARAWSQTRRVVRRV